MAQQASLGLIDGSMIVQARQAAEKAASGSAPVRVLPKPPPPAFDNLDIPEPPPVPKTVVLPRPPAVPKPPTALRPPALPKDVAAIVPKPGPKVKARPKERCWTCWFLVGTTEMICMYIPYNILLDLPTKNRSV